MWIDRSSLGRQARHWVMHVALNAAPSFIIAWDVTDAWRWQGGVAMVCGVLCFMVGYTVVTSSVWYVRRVPGSAFGRALRWATRFRSGMAVGALIGMIPGPGGGMLMAPLVLSEVFAGMAAIWLVGAFGRSAWVSALRVWLTGPVPEERAASVWVGDITSIVPTFLITLVEGGLLSLVMLGLAALLTIAQLLGHRRATRGSSALRDEASAPRS